MIGLLVGEELDDDAEAFVHSLALGRRLDAEHPGVAGQGAGADAEHGAAAGQVVEEDDAVGGVERVVVGDADDARPEADVLVIWLAAAMNTSGLAMISQPAEWCSPIQASSKPSSSRLTDHAPGRAACASVGFSPSLVERRDE